MTYQSGVTLSSARDGNGWAMALAYQWLILLKLA